jgi:ElaB/YqjD/DUF883 family membrane-anchored ribosome-binding protein
MATEIGSGNQTKEVKEMVDNARDSLRTAFDKGSEKAAQFKDAAFDRGRNALTTIERTIEERPMAVVGGVFLGGILLGMLLSRR